MVDSRPTARTNVTMREPTAFCLKNSRVALMNTRFPQMPWPEAIPKHIHMTLPDTACDKWPTNKYCEFTGNDPARFLQRTWIASGLNPGFSLKVHNDSECDSFLRDFSRSNSRWHDAHKLWTSIPYGVIKSDFWRTAFILAHGGVYSDADVEPVASLRSFVRPDDIFVTSGSLYHAQTNFHFMVASPGEPALAKALSALMQTIRSTRYSYWTWSGCKPLFNGLVSVRNDSAANPSFLGEGFRTSRGFYRILLERKVAGWSGIRKATCEQVRLSEPNRPKLAHDRLLLLNKYVAIPGAIVANASRASHWGSSLDLWGAQDQRLHLHNASSDRYLLHPTSSAG